MSLGHDIIQPKTSLTILCLMLRLVVLISFQSEMRCHPSHPLSSPSPPAFNLSQHQDLFQGVSSLHQVAKVLDEMVGWHHQLDGHESEQAPGVGDGQGSLSCCSPWGRKESDTTEQLN